MPTDKRHRDTKYWDARPARRKLAGPESICAGCGQPVRAGRQAEHARCEELIQSAIDAEFRARKKPPPSPTA